MLGADLVLMAATFLPRLIDRMTTHLDKSKEIALCHQDEFVRPLIECWTFSRDGRLWKLKEIHPAEKGAALLTLENTDESSSGETQQ